MNILDAIVNAQNGVHRSGSVLTRRRPRCLRWYRRWPLDSSGKDDVTSLIGRFITRS
jgi:hypothetical protein